MIRTPPLAVRNRLAETIVAALGDHAARAALDAIARQPETWVGAEHARFAALVGERARRAAAALAGHAPAPPSDLPAALAAAAVLFDAGLYFEVHEVLEPHWAAASGPDREALQGLVQVAVGWQHLANDNMAGARSLLEDGATRLHGGRLAGVDLDPFARAALQTAAALPQPGAPPRFPHF